MMKLEYIEKIKIQKVDDKKIEIIQKLYTDHLPQLLKQIISDCDKAIFFEDGTRILSFREIVNAEKDLHVPFRKMCLIPVADCGENDFIVFDFKNGNWAMFNIVDEISFMESDSFEELLNR